MCEEKSILIVDDEPNIRRVLDAVFTKAGYQVFTAENGHKALDIVSTEPLLNVILCDLIMPDLNGIDVLKAVRDVNPRISIVMMTAHGTIKSAVDAIKLGAFDYVTKPFDVDEIKMVVKNALERSRLIDENIQLKQELKSKYRFDEIVGSSGKMQEVFRIIERVADSNATVLIRGESGTGKELVARAIHFNSKRSGKPFIPIACAALPESLLESELFGHEKGAFTGAAGQKAGRFELANKGTLFLDEISEIPPSIQVKLLRVLQERSFERVGGVKTLKIDVRLVAASNRDLEDAVSKGEFREDLYYRLQVIQVFLPPLRDRKEDIPQLVEHFVGKFNKANGKNIKFVDQSVMDMLMTYNWPGNVRELENTVERGIVLADHHVELITPDLLPLAIQKL
ncbi:MAG TPA: sigma-54 dependent transcriptional regulator [Armatimonadota bacterium]|jgi:DNA-binding NtrC family response regulator